jgi:Spirocyclase AveC-like
MLKKWKSPNGCSYPAIRTGPDHYGMLWYLRGLEALSAASTVFLFGLFVIRPLIRECRMSFDGKLVIGMMIGYFWEPMVNYYNFTFAFNAHGVNFGTWANFIPGFSYPHQAYLPDGTLYAMPQYVYSGVLLSLIGAWWLRYAREHITRFGPMGRWIGLFFGLAPIWMPFEYVFFILPKVWIYESVVPSLSLFAGTWHQFPIYEGFIMALFGCGMTFLRVTRADQGR